MTTEGSDSRSLIERAAREEFRLHGFDGARIDRVSKRSGLNKQLIYYYFGSKQELYEHTLRLAAEAVRIEPSVRRSLSGSPADRLRALLETMFSRVAAAPEIIQALVRDEGETAGSSSAGRLMSDLAEELGREISRGQGLGYYRDDADPALLGRQTIAILVGWGVLHGAQGRGGEPQPTGWADATADLLARFLSW